MSMFEIEPDQDVYLRAPDDEVRPWVCPCPECNGVRDLLPEDEEDGGAWEEPSAESMVESEWVWAG